jgi:HlyD family secretion protein
VKPRSLRSGVARPVLLAAALAGVAVIAVSCSVMGRSRKVSTVVTEVVARRDIDQTVQATGTVEPVETVEIKSKASGQILRMPVEVGSVVRAGQLLAQIDTVNVQNQYDQASASLRAAQAGVEVTAAQKKRADELFSREVITTDQFESATLAYANSQSDLVRARSSLEIARQALADATVRAPANGTILAQPVVKGQVITSATQSMSGGTTLLMMADLNRIQMRALVGETDIGSVRAGQPATVAVDAFPNRTFRGQVVKVEPQAVVQQAVTMFPVLVTIENEDGLLLPGMNGEVTVYIEQRTGVLAVPLDAVRTVRELPAVATALGVNADSVQAQVQRQVEARRAARAAADSTRGDAGPTRGDAGPTRGRGEGRGPGGPGARGGEAGSGHGSDGARHVLLGAAGPSQGPGGGGAQHGGAGMGARQAQVVFVKTPRGLEPRIVRLGISDFDYVQVTDGLEEGDEVALLSVAEVQAKRQNDQAQLRQRMGSGMPGVGAPGGGGRGGPGGH